MKILALFPLVALASGIAVSIYLLAKWLRHERRHKYLLFWALALFLMYWFQVPMALSLLGRTMVMTDFNLFFALTLPITFLALVLICLGLFEVLGVRLGKTAKLLFWFWFLFALAFFAYYFISNEGIIRTYSMPILGNVVFYLPIRCLIIFIVLKHFRKCLEDKMQTTDCVMGTVLIAGESVIGIFRNILIVKTVLAYPPAFWYVAMSSLKIFFILQASSVIMLSLGFLFLYRFCLARNRPAVDKVA